MKFILEDRDQRNIDNINKDLQGGINDCPLFVSGEPGKKYYLEFEVTDIAKANTFVANMLLTSKSKEVRDTLGIDIKCLAYSGPDRKIDGIKEFLRNALNELERM